MSEKHTPGPWIAKHHAGTQTGPFWGVWQGDKPAMLTDRIAVLDATGAIDEANAKLIAAAPDLLAELGGCQEVMDATASQLSGEYLDPKEIQAIADQLALYAMNARAAIAKATA